MLAGIPRSAFFNEYRGYEIDDFVPFMCFRCTNFHIPSSPIRSGVKVTWVEVTPIPFAVNRHAVAQVAYAIGFAFLRGVRRRG